MERLGVFGGSFNPVHWGHLHIALLAREAARLDRVLFVPAASPPHKEASALAPAPDRTAMLAAALDEEPGTAISDLELRPDGPRYTIETLTRLRDEHPGAQLPFILGLDSLRDLPTWREPKRILREFGLIVVDRPGLDPAALPPDFLTGIRWVGGNPFAISSTAIRERVSRGLSIRHLVPPAVAAVIEERGLYRAGSGA
jgi:nicotinate-nucleotide adenylyltransferase